MFRFTNSRITEFKSSLLPICLLILINTSCKDKQHEVGKFVYVDKYVTIHIDRECAAQSEHNAKTDAVKIGEGIIFVDTCNLAYRFHNEIGSRSYMFCPKCINDDAYQRLVAIMDRNCALSTDSAVVIESDDLDLSTTTTTGGWASGLKL